MSKYIVGAYPASPAHRTWDPAAEEGFFSLLASDSRIGSLELPWMGALHPHDTKWLDMNFPKNLVAVVTSIPFVMGQLGNNPNYGIASPEEASRAMAIAHLREIFDSVTEFHQKIGRRAVSHVEIHSAPRQVGSSSQLAKSLREIASWDWQGVNIVIEHCDAFISGQHPEKGFLSISDEIAAIQSSGCEVGILINWGRSAIEFRDASRVVEHIESAKSANLLQGLIFSGASNVEGLFGYPWIDAHHPFRKNVSYKFGDPESLLTEELAKAAMRAAGEIPLIGIKMGWPSSIAGTLDERYQMISAALALLDS